MCACVPTAQCPGVSRCELLGIEIEDDILFNAVGFNVLE